MSYMYINEFMGELFYNGEYDKLIADIREISISSDDMNREGNNYIDLLFLKLTKLETLNISTYNLDSGESGGYFEFAANNNITVNIKLNSDTQYIALNIKDAAAPVSITLNLLELCETENAVLDVFANSGEGSNILDVRVNANCNELDYVTKYYKGISVEGFNTSVFTYAQELIIEGFKFRALQDYGNVYGLELTEFTDGGEVVVPDNIQGFEIGVVLLPAEMLQGKTLRIILPQASDTVGRMAVHIISYGEEGGNYPFVQGLNNGRLMNENISLVLPCDNTDIGVDVLSDGHILRAEYTNTYEILMDGSTYEQIDKVNIAVLVGAYEHTIY
ncbi:MAG: hypothetical protein K2I79_01290, partial [Clostridia bacterium]|nr:hypothetical protein [Clostridia bacterium]